MKKLYRVEVYGIVYVYSDSLEQAEHDAKEGVQMNEYEYFDYDVCPAGAKTIKEDGWGEGCIPYGKTNDKTCEELLKEQSNEKSI